MRCHRRRIRRTRIRTMDPAASIPHVLIGFRLTRYNGASFARSTSPFPTYRCAKASLPNNASWTYLSAQARAPESKTPGGSSNRSGAGRQKDGGSRPSSGGGLGEWGVGGFSPRGGGGGGGGGPCPAPGSR